jgi:hypothetical protein
MTNALAVRVIYTSFVVEPRMSPWFGIETGYMARWVNIPSAVTAICSTVANNVAAK